MKQVILLGLLAILAAPSVHGAGFQLSKVLGSNMVLLDYPRQANIFGFGTPGQVVTIKVDGVDAAFGTVDINEQFIIPLPPYPAGGPHTITVSQGDETITLENVLFGEVWVCSGQSNMEFGMIEIYNATEEIADAVNYPDIRVMLVQKVTSDVQLNDIPAVGITWRSPETDTNTFGRTSSLCFLHARELQKVIAKPIGAISSSWGGTRVEAWSSAAALASCGIVESPNPNPGPNEASVLWNAMIYPMTKMAITGAIWYQGESNVGGGNYDCTFPSMIDDWRRNWNVASLGHTGPEFPFGFIQLATTGAGNFGYGDLRWRQTAGYGYVPNERMPNVVMGTGLDTEDDGAPTGSIHPRDKQTLASRLSWAMLHHYYGRTEYPLRGPEVTSAVRDGSTVVITYDQSIITKGTVGFHAMCSGNRVAAPVIASTTDSVTIDITSVAGCEEGQLEVTYGWDSRPCDYKTCAVYAAGIYDITQSAWVTML